MFENLENIIFYAICVLACTLIFFPFGLFMGYWIDGRDIRKFGSGNIGGTNVWRVYGPTYGGITILFDAIKGALPILLIANILKGFTNSELIFIQISIGIFTIMANIFNPFLKFGGGKGIATGIGILIALDWQIAILTFGAFFVMFAIHKYNSKDVFKASITGSFTAVACSIGMMRPVPEIIFLTVVLILVIFSHRKNIHDFNQLFQKPL